MNIGCAAFRAALEQALSRAGQDLVPSRLAWNEHLLACSACRELLSSEAALESLLRAGVGKQPLELPPKLVGRVLARLRAERVEQRLDELLARWHAPAEVNEAGAAVRDRGAAISTRILARLASERAEPARERLPVPRKIGAAPTLDALPELSVPRPSAVRQGRRATWLIAALAAGLLAWVFVFERRAPDRIDSSSVAMGASAVDTGAEDVALEVPEELLASLEFFEQWEALSDSELEEMMLTTLEFESLLADLDLAEQGRSFEAGPAQAPEEAMPASPPAPGRGATGASPPAPSQG